VADSKGGISITKNAHDRVQVSITPAAQGEAPARPKGVLRPQRGVVFSMIFLIFTFCFASTRIYIFHNGP